MSTVKIVILSVISLYLIVGLLFFVFQESFIFLAEKLDNNFHYDLPFRFEEKNFATEDGSNINALHIRADTTKGVIFYAHGNAGSLARWGAIGGYFTKFGYDVLIYDYRGYGKSNGKRSMKNFYSDAQMLYDQLLSEYQEKDIVLYGRSLGTGIVTKIAADNHPGKLILETPYYSLSSVASKYYPLFPVNLLLRYPFSSYKYIQAVNCPIYIFHGTYDRLIPYQSGEKLFELVEKTHVIKMITIEGGDHNDLISFKVFEQQIGMILK